MLERTPSRRFALTLFPDLSYEGVTPDDIQELIVIGREMLSKAFVDLQGSYLICGLETCPQTGKIHFQCYIELKKRKTAGAVKTLIERATLMTPHVEIAKGTGPQNREYCTKENRVILEKGELMSQGKRSDLMELKESIENGKSKADLWDLHFKEMIKYHKAVDTYLNVHEEPRETWTKIFIYWGSTGTGKTRDAFRYSKENNCENPYVHMGTSNFFEGYENQSVCIFDEFDGDQVPFHYWKQLCDRYPMRVNVKGSSRQWNPKTIIFTSNVDPRHWWPHENKPHNWWEQLMRRIRESGGKITHYANIVDIMENQ